MLTACASRDLAYSSSRAGVYVCHSRRGLGELLDVVPALRDPALRAQAIHIVLRSDWSSVDPHVAKSAEWWRAANPSPNCPVFAADAVSRVRQVASALLRGMLAASGDAVSGTKLHPRPQAPPGLRDPRARRSAPGPAERPGPYLAASLGYRGNATRARARTPPMQPSDTRRGETRAQSPLRGLQA